MKAHAYGAQELKLAAHRYMFVALSISIFIHFSIIGSYYFSAALGTQLPKPLPPTLGPLVNINEVPIPGISSVPPPTTEKPTKSPKAGTIVPLGPGVGGKEDTFATQGQLGKIADIHWDQFDFTGTIKFPDVIPIEKAPVDTFIALEKEPVLVRTSLPAYPPSALKAGLEGVVFVRVWVDKEGKVRQVNVVKSNNDIFNDAAVDAAKQFVFTPAYMNSGPVSVWVGLPIRFRLSTSR